MDPPGDAKQEADSKRPDSHPAARVGVLKKLIFSALVVLIFFGLVELVLLIAGVKPLLYDDDPHVGFASSIPLYVKGGDQMVTAPNKLRWFNEQRFPRTKAANTRRIFCMGGSTTFGRPFRDPTSFCGWLRAYLPAADPDQKWELINAGGISYASYRVAALMEELADYQPDLFIIYSGHNEFLEQRTYGEIMEMPSAIRGLQAQLSRSRTYSLIARTVKGKGGNKSGAAGGGSELAAEVNPILDSSVGPDAYTRDEGWKQQVLAHYRFNLARMVDIARASGAEVIFVTPGSNLRNCTPFKSQHRDGLGAEQLARWEALFQQARQAFEAGEVDAALAAATAAVEIDPEYAHLQYLRGQILDALGKTAEAKAAYQLALANDICPLRLLPEMAPIIAEVAADRGVDVVDFQQMVDDLAKDHIPGDDVFFDHVHPTIEAQRLLALALIDKLAESGFLKRAAAWGEELVERIKERVMAGVDEHERGIALRNLANVLQWAGKYQDAYGVAKKSLELTPGDAYANFVAGDLAEKLGKKDEAMQQYQFLTSFNVNTKDAPYFVETHFKYAGLLAEKGEFAECVRLLRKTLSLKPDHAGAAEALPETLKTWGTKLLQAGQGSAALEPLRQLEQLTPADPNVANWLGIALIQAGKPAEAIPYLQKVLGANADNSSAHNNIATAYAQSGDQAMAAHHFKETVRLQPAHLGAVTNLGELSFQSGDFAAASGYFRRALEIQPGHPPAVERLRQIAERRAAPAEK